MKNPLVSVVIPTKNSGKTLEACLVSVEQQTYSPIEIIVVDNQSQDKTLEIAQRFTQNIHKGGNERSAQRNIGITKAKGEYVCIIDSDMELEQCVIADAVDIMKKNTQQTAVIIPEKSFGTTFWATCRTLEKSLYIRDPFIEAARFFRKDILLTLGGYNEKLISGEDWELMSRLPKKGTLGRVTSFINHNEGSLTLSQVWKKKVYYGRYGHDFLQVMSQPKPQLQPLYRLSIFWRHKRSLIKQPVVTIGLLLLKIVETTAALIGFLKGYNQHSLPEKPPYL